ncbi:MAG: RsmB/NOP family class I SAM-dependent RNA methyltransferase [Pseudomonadota bacterium]
MTPGARVAAAIAVLDDIAGGTAAEQALTRWARRSRFAGSKDRQAVRDHVFDVLRQRNTCALNGGGSSGRALMLGKLRIDGVDPQICFDGAGYAPAALVEPEKDILNSPLSDDADLDLPEWMRPLFQRALGVGWRTTAGQLRSRAPITIRANTARTTRDELAVALSSEGITALPNPVADTALAVKDGARQLRNTKSFHAGHFEFQDAASQALVLGLPDARTALDYCAGGGGKALAMAARGFAVSAHDANPKRMADLPERARRAGAQITIETQADQIATYDLVLCDVPCSGSGAWRRSPEGKWALTPARLEELTATQDSILDNARLLVRDQGTLVYATCSVLWEEDEDRIDAFLSRHQDWSCTQSVRWDVSDDCDGFFAAHLTRE